MSYRNQPVRELTVVEALRKEMGAELRAANERADKAERERDNWKAELAGAEKAMSEWIQGYQVIATERDSLRAQVEALTKEREAAHAELEDLGAPDNRCCGYPLNQQQAELSLVERIAIIGNRLAEAENTATAQVEMLAGVVRKHLDEFCPKWSYYDQCSNNTRYNDCTFCSMRPVADLVRSLPHAGARWAKMEAALEAAGATLAELCESCDEENHSGSCDEEEACSVWATSNQIQQALDDLAKVVG